MDAAHTENIQKHVRKYITVFIALLALTLITVAISRLHLGTAGNVAVALVIAGVKGSLVASYFMHLISEKKVIFLTLLITVVLFIVLMWLPIFTISDPVVYKHVP